MSNGKTTFELEPSRQLVIQKPELYRGQLGQAGSDMWRNDKHCYIVNGHIHKADGNFIFGLSFDKIGNTGIYLGGFPQSEEEVETLSKAGVNHIFCVQTKEDMKFRNVDWDHMV
jgi:hypothetical protein